jgi:hypothetical protein
LGVSPCKSRTSLGKMRKMDEIHLLFYLFHKDFVEKPINEELGPRNENYGL